MGWARMRSHESCFDSRGLTLYSLMGLALMLLNEVPVQAVMGQTTGNSTKASLKIAVPVRGFNDFVKMVTDPNTGNETVGGFSIEVFKAVIPPSVNFDLFAIDFTRPDGSSIGTFDDVLRDVSSQKYDAAVGDISLVDYRTQWVDFTFPYLETGISMLVPKRQNQQSIKTTRISSSRATKGFVVGTLAFCLIIVLVFWVLEHRNDKYCYQPRPLTPHLPIGQYDDDWRRELLRSVIHTRFIMVLFFMLLLVLIACYATSQISSLSENRTSSSVNNLNQLIRKRVNVGYQQGSFIKDLLVQKGIWESNLTPFSTSDEMFNLLTEGGIAAVVGLTPHLRLRQAEHCDVYTLVPTFNLHAAGFGFAFPKGSLLVHNVSNGILSVIYSGQLGRIQDRTIGSLETCQDDQNGETHIDMIDIDTLGILVASAICAMILVVILMLVHCGITCNTTRKKKKVVAYPCYMLPCC